MNAPAVPLQRRPATWAIVLAFALVYLAWGTTYLAIKEGVRALPPFLFAGVRITLAGGIILGFLAFRGEPLRLSGREWFWAAIGGITLFVGGNGVISIAQQTVDSGMASVLASTTPLWIALLECTWPDGDRLSFSGWLGILAGLAGVMLLLAPQLKEPGSLLRDVGPLLVLVSAFSWSLGSMILRYRKRSGSHLTAAGLQMLLGGIGLTLIGLSMGETRGLTVQRFTPVAIYSFFHLLIVGSLVGFVAYTWLLQHVSAALAGTYAYVNPLVAILVGWLLGGEEITIWIAGGMAIILAGVFLVRSGGIHLGHVRKISGDETQASPDAKSPPDNAIVCADGPTAGTETSCCK